MPEGYFDEKRATVRVGEMSPSTRQPLREIEVCAGASRARRDLRDVAAEWLEYLEREGRKAVDIQDYGYLLADPGEAAPAAARAGAAGPDDGRFGDRPITKVRTAAGVGISRDLDGEGTRRAGQQVRSAALAMFQLCLRVDTYACRPSPVQGTGKRREAPPAVLDFFEPEEIEALARAGRRRSPAAEPTARGAWTRMRSTWRAREDSAGLRALPGWRPTQACAWES